MSLNVRNVSNAKIAARIELISQELSGIDQLEENALSSKAESSKYMAEKQNLFNELRQKREQLNEQMTTVKIAIASNEELLFSIEEESVCAEATVDSPAREPITIEAESNKLMIFFIFKNPFVCVPIIFN